MGVKLRQKNDDGKWWLMIHHKGQRSTRCLGLIDRRQAERIRKEVETRLSMQDLGLLRSQAPTVQEYVSSWLEVVQARNKPSTLARYISIASNHILPYIGHLSIDRVTSDDCKDMMLGWQKRLARGGAKTNYNVTKAMFSECMADKHISENPLPKFVRIFGSGSALPTKDEIRVISSNELERILQHAYESLPQAYGALFTFLARTGCRLGEGLGMNWVCLNLQAGTAEIRASYSDKYGLSSPKNGRHRTVALSPLTVRMLNDLKGHMEKTYWTLGRAMPEAVFITHSTGNRISPQLARGGWNRCLSALGLPGYRIHDMRHSFASRLIALGETIKTVQMALGHCSARMTLDVYGHLLPENPYPDVAALDPHPGRTQSQKNRKRA